MIAQNHVDNCILKSVQSNIQIIKNSYHERNDRNKYPSRSWFHGKMDRETAELTLQPRTDGLYLVRESNHFPGDYTLCVV